MIDHTEPDATKFMEWLYAECDKPGVLVLTYDADAVVPSKYHFNPVDAGAEPSVGVRLFLNNFEGECEGVEYLTAYPKAVGPDDQPVPEDEITPDLSEYMWRMGWLSVMQNASLAIAKMQSDLTYKTAKELGFDIDKFTDEAEQYLPSETAIEYTLAYLRYLRVRKMLAERPLSQRITGCNFMIRLAEQVLSHIEQVAKGED